MVYIKVIVINTIYTFVATNDKAGTASTSTAHRHCGKCPFQRLSRHRKTVE